MRYSCGTAPSNPPAEIRWTIDGKYMNSTTQTSPGKDGGMISNSSILFTVRPNKRSYTISCNGINMDYPEHISKLHTLNVLCKNFFASSSFSSLLISICICTDPPSTPIITGYTEGSILKAGVTVKLLCSSQGGNPPAALTWFKNDRKVRKLAANLLRQTK